MSRHRRATIEFDDATNMFKDLVIETLEQSEFIECAWEDGEHVVYETVDDSEYLVSATIPAIPLKTEVEASNKWEAMENAKEQLEAEHGRVDIESVEINER